MLESVAFVLGLTFALAVLTEQMVEPAGDLTSVQHLLAVVQLLVELIVQMVGFVLLPMEIAARVESAVDLRFVQHLLAVVHLLVEQMVAFVLQQMEVVEPVD